MKNPKMVSPPPFFFYLDSAAFGEEGGVWRGRKVKNLRPWYLKQLSEMLFVVFISMCSEILSERRDVLKLMHVYKIVYSLVVRS